MKTVDNKPIASVSFGDYSAHIIETYKSGKEFYKNIRRLPKDTNIKICFGHKFFWFLTDAKNKWVWVVNKTSTPLIDFDEWDKCIGVVSFQKNIIKIDVTGVIKKNPRN